MTVLRAWTDVGPDGDELARPVLVQAFSPGWRAVSSALVGGGIGPIDWWMNAQVNRHYDRVDPAVHAHEIAAGLGLDVSRPGVAMLTAADPSRFTRSADHGVEVIATVGLGLPVPAAAPDEIHWDSLPANEDPLRPGTINLLVRLPVPLSDAALVNAVLTSTEAKTQALVESGVPGTGTSSDAVCIACPLPETLPGEPVEDYGGPRSCWGARLARAVHRAVAEGATDWTAAHPPGDEHRFWGARWP